jgi:hypothetical protein
MGRKVLADPDALLMRLFLLLLLLLLLLLHLLLHLLLLLAANLGDDISLGYKCLTLPVRPLPRK